MAEGVGFEPTGRVNAQRFSRPPLSATQPSLRLESAMSWELRAQTTALHLKNGVFISLLSAKNHHLIKELPHVRPPPNAVKRTSLPFTIVPFLTASSRAIGTVAEDILPYFSMVM